MKLKIGSNRTIGDGFPCFIIAEIGSNHDGKLNQAKKLIDEAKNAGADCVKFQSFKADELVVRHHPSYDILRKLELPENWLYKLTDYCKKKHILFSYTPFYLKVVDILNKIKAPFYKISSGDLTYYPLIEKITRLKKPIFLSTGAAYLNEIKRTVSLIRKYKNNKLVILHCVSLYPPKIKEVNLNCLKTLRKELNLLVGLSDHTRSLIVPVGAVALGACVIEKHFTLSRKLKGPDYSFAMEPDEFKDMVRAIRELEVAKGSFCKHPVKSEIPERFFARRKPVKIGNEIKYLRPYK